MNHLAHCFLSFGDEDALLGNFIGDFVKGRDWQHYPTPVQRGILLHRAIDSYTDNHPMTDRSVDRVRPFAGRWSPPFVDILYDHLLAIFWEKYAAEPFAAFAEKTYRQLENRAAEMPPALQERLPKMLAGQFLHGYTRREGLEWVLDRFSRRLPGEFDAAALSKFFFDKIEDFSADFNAFFPDLLSKSRATYAELGAAA
jgi:acyl carrier protein phosphodiesterase